jgi:8-oxo-dGTP pyrophosphatase MutT (NUDIX family)
MRWIVESERTLYGDSWLQVRIADVVLPDGRHLDHRKIHSADGAYTVLVDRGRVLLMWRHRFITDSWGWEIPGGAVDPGEQPLAAAAREAEEETGWRPEPPLRPLLRIRPMPGLLIAEHHVFRADSATYLGPPADGHESDRIDWVPLDRIAALIDSGDIVEGTTVAALLRLIASPERRC